MILAIPTNDRKEIAVNAEKAKEFAIYEMEGIKTKNTFFKENRKLSLLNHVSEKEVYISELLANVDFLLFNSIEKQMREILNRKNIKFQFTSENIIKNAVENFMYQTLLVKNLISIEHPSIALTLSQLGILQDIDINVKAKNVSFTLVFPFPNIPIADQLISMVKEPINKLNFKADYEIKTMNEEEKKYFLELETQAWKGN